MSFEKGHQFLYLGVKSIELEKTTTFCDHYGE